MTLLAGPVEMRVVERRLFVRRQRVVTVRPFRLRDLPMTAPLLPLLRLDATSALVKHGPECGMLLMIATDLSPRDIHRLTPESIAALVETVWHINADVAEAEPDATPAPAGRKIGGWTVTEAPSQSAKQRGKSAAGSASLAEAVEYLVSAGHPMSAVLDYTLPQIRELYALAQRRGARERLAQRQASVIDAAVAAGGDRASIEKHLRGLAGELKALR